MPVLMIVHYAAVAAQLQTVVCYYCIVYTCLGNYAYSDKRLVMIIFECMFMSVGSANTAISDLDKGTSYTATVTGHNIRGPGTASESVTAQTRVDR